MVVRPWWWVTRRGRVDGSRWVGGGSCSWGLSGLFRACMISSYSWPGESRNWPGLSCSSGFSSDLGPSGAGIAGEKTGVGVAALPGDAVSREPKTEADGRTAISLALRASTWPSRVTTARITILVRPALTGVEIEKTPCREIWTDGLARAHRHLRSLFRGSPGRAQDLDARCLASSGACNTLTRSTTSARRPLHECRSGRLTRSLLR